MTSSTVPIVNAGLKYVNGLDLAWVSNTTFTMAAGAARDSGNSNDIVLSAGVTLNAAVNGVVNGLDTGALAANTMYAIYVIGDSTQHKATGALLSLSFTQPSLPGGYDMYRLTGAILTDSSSHFLLFWESGQGTSRTYYYDVGISELSAGSSTSYADVDLATSVPPIATNVLMIATYTPNSATNVAHLLPTGSSATNGIVRIGGGVAAAQVSDVSVPCRLKAGSPTIQYKVQTSDTLSLITAGYTLAFA